MNRSPTDLREVINTSELAAEAGRNARTVRDWVARQLEKLPEAERPLFARRLEGTAGWLVSRHHPLIEQYIATEPTAGRPVTASQHDNQEE